MIKQTWLAAVAVVTAVGCAVVPDDGGDPIDDGDDVDPGDPGDPGDPPQQPRSIPDAWDCWTYAPPGGVQHTTSSYYDPTNGATRTCPTGRGCVNNTPDASCTPVASQGFGCWSNANSCQPDHRM